MNSIKQAATYALVEPEIYLMVTSSKSLAATVGIAAEMSQSVYRAGDAGVYHVDEENELYDPPL